MVQQGHNFKENLSSIEDMFENSKIISSLKDIFYKAKTMVFTHKEINSILQGIYQKSISSTKSSNIQSMIARMEEDRWGKFIWTIILKMADQDLTSFRLL